MTYNIIENEYQRDLTSAYQLSILVGVDSLVYSVYDSISNKLLALKSLSFSTENGHLGSLAKTLDGIISKEDLLSPEYQQVKIVFMQTQASLVPDRLFNEEEKNTYLEELTTPPDEVETQVDEIAPLQIRSVYSLDTDVSELLRTKFPTSSFFSVSTPFLVGSHHAIPEDATEIAFACFHHNTFQLALFEKGELLFYNQFSFNSASDVLYFVLLSYEQYGLDTGTVPLYLSGQVVNDSDIYKILYRYIAELTFLPSPTFFQLGKSASSSDPNFFFPLHSLLLCK